jgi:hypothetical protein
MHSSLTFNSLQSMILKQSQVREDENPFFFTGSNSTSESTPRSEESVWVGRDAADSDPAHRQGPGASRGKNG